MDSFSRLGAYLWPYRKRVVLSVVCAIGISLLWSLNLSITFPIVRVLFESDSLHARIDTDIEELNAQITAYEDAQNELRGDQYSEQARLQRKLNTASQTLVFKQWIKTSVLPWTPVDKFQTMLAILAFVVVATTVKGLLVYSQELLVGSVIHASSNDLRRDAFNNLIQLDYQTINRIGTSQLTSRLTNDVSELTAGLKVFGLQLVREPLKAFCCIAAAFLFNWRLTCISMLVLPMIGLLFYRSGRVMRSAARNTMETMSTIYQSVSESLSSTRVVIAYNGEPRQRAKLNQANSEYYGHSMRLVRVSALIRPVTELLGIVAFTLVLVPGAYLVLNNTNEIFGIKMAAAPLGIAELTTLYVLMAGALDPIRKLSTVFPQIKRSVAASERIFAVTDFESAVKEVASPIETQPHQQSIEFDRVSFRYASDLEPETAETTLPAINSLTMKIPFGQVVAIVGGNGSGKSTLVSLLPRLMDPTNGAVRIDGVDIRQQTLAGLRRQIGLVSQDTVLFNDTILNNIRYGRPDASEADVEKALKQAHAWELIAALPDGLETLLGDGGRNLSGGQRQRLALARAIIRNPSILIMDEATSAIDVESEELIHGALKTFCKGRTVFIVTHDLSTALMDIVDRIVVMEHGKVVADGPHETLMNISPFYQRLISSSQQSSRAA